MYVVLFASSIFAVSVRFVILEVSTLEIAWYDFQKRRLS
jgi:hypothetical protein